MTRSSTLRAVAALPLSAVVGLAPLPALADGSIAAAPLQLRAPLSPAPLGLKLMTRVSLQDPGAPPVEGEVVAPPPEGAPPPVMQGPQPYPPPPPPYGPPPEAEPPSGFGALITGSVLTGAVALPAIIGGVYIISVFRTADDQSNDSGGTGLLEASGNILGGFFVVFGVIALGVGAPLIGVGAVRVKRHRDWEAAHRQQVRFTPSSGRTPHGTWTAGVTMRF